MKKAVPQCYSAKCHSEKYKLLSIISQLNMPLQGVILLNVVPQNVILLNVSIEYSVVIV
jgi:hypothetical protein